MFGTDLKHIGVITCSNADKLKTFNTILDLINTQIKLKLTVLSINIHENDYGNELLDFLKNLKSLEIVKNNQIKVTILGKWYDLEQEIVESIKEVINETKYYDKFFLNLCINYDGQESILDACKIIARMTHLGKLDPESIKKEDIKENLSTSLFIPPDLIIKTGKINRLKGFMLWDSTRSLIHFTGRPWSEFDGKEMEKIIKKY